MALLIAVVSIALMTVVATEFAFNSRVDLQLAANARDEIRAYYLARSGIGFSRLLLRAQKQLDQVQLPNLATLLGGPGGVAGGAGAPPITPSLQIWRMAHVDCHMLKGLVKEEPERPGAPPRQKLGSSSSDFDTQFPELALRQKRRSFGGFEGCFRAELSDEEERLNLAKLDAVNNKPLVARALDLFGDKRFEFLYEHEDSNRVKSSPTDILIALRDWIDEDEVQSTLNLTGAGDPFLRGFSDENFAYDRYTPRYKAKNARFDSLDELYLVHGVNDAFMAAFKDRLTIYPDVNSKPNINTEDPLLLYMAILSAADPAKPDPRLRDPLFIDALIQKIQRARMMSLFGMSVLDFVGIIEVNGVAVNPTIKNNLQLNPFLSDKSNTYRIKSVGEAGQVQKTITAVIRLDGGLGRLLHWREE